MQGLCKQDKTKNSPINEIEETPDDLNQETNSPKSKSEEDESSEKQSSPVDTSATETSLAKNNKRTRQEDVTVNKKQKTDKNNLFRLTISFPSGGPTYNYKEVIQEVLKHCNHVNNPAVLTAKFENTESLNKSFESLCKMKVDNKCLWLKRRYLPDVGSVNPLKKLAYLPKSAATQLDGLKEYYEADSIEPLGKKGNAKLHVLSFKTEEEATAAAEKKGYETNGYIVNLRQFFEFDKKDGEKGKEQAESSEEKPEIKDKEDNDEEEEENNGEDAGNEGEGEEDGDEGEGEDDGKEGEGEDEGKEGDDNAEEEDVENGESVVDEEDDN